MSTDVLVPHLDGEAQTKSGRSSTMASAATDVPPAEWSNQQVWASWPVAVSSPFLFFLLPYASYL